MAVPYDDPESPTRYCRRARSAVESLRAVGRPCTYRARVFEEACITRQLSLMGRRQNLG